MNIQREKENFDRDWQEEFWEQVEMYYERSRDRREDREWEDLKEAERQLWWNSYSECLQEEKDAEELFRDRY